MYIEFGDCTKVHDYIFGSKNKNKNNVLFIPLKFSFLSFKIIKSDKNDIVVEAFKAIINSIMAYSLTKLVGQDHSEDVRTEANTQIMSILTSLLDHKVY